MQRSQGYGQERKRDRPYDSNAHQYQQNGNGQQPWKKQRIDGGHGHGQKNANHAPLGPNGRNRGYEAHHVPGSNPHAFDKTNPVLRALSQMPDDTKKCKPCVLAAEQMQTGLAALLGHLIAEEAGDMATSNPDDDEINADILHHARALQTLLEKRASRSFPNQEKKELDKKRQETISAPAISPITSSMARTLQLSKALPPLPPITNAHLETAVFTHASMHDSTKSSVRGFRAEELNYEKLEFLGDAYIEVISSRLIYSRFPDLETSQQSYFREQLVKNETLSGFSRAYGFGERVKHGSHEVKTGKGWPKILADVFEAYVAAVVLSSPPPGSTRSSYEIVEAWLTQLWTPQLLAGHASHTPLENPAAREDLNKLVMAKGVKLNYKEEREMGFVNGRQKFFMGVYLTGWGFEDEWLGSGEGQNKSQACVMAAMDALNGSKRKSVVDVAAAKKREVYPVKSEEELAKEREERKQKKEKERLEKMVESV